MRLSALCVEDMDMVILGFIVSVLLLVLAVGALNHHKISKSVSLCCWPVSTSLSEESTDAWRDKNETEALNC